MNKIAYQIGVSKALEDAGIIKEARYRQWQRLMGQLAQSASKFRRGARNPRLYPEEWNIVGQLMSKTKAGSGERMLADEFGGLHYSEALRKMRSILAS